MPEETSRKPRAFWSGTLAFGLVSVPVSLFVAQRPRRTSLRMVDEEGTPLSRRYFCRKDERALDRDEIVRGYEVEKDRFVLVEDEELEALAPEKSQEIDLKRFVELSDIDPVYFERAYFLAPDRGAVKAYRLLARTMEEAGRAGIATFVMRGKEYLVAIIAERGLLRAETLRFHDELRSPKDVGLPPLEKSKSARVRDMENAMKSLSADRLDREALADSYGQRLHDLVRRKIEAGEDVVEEPAPPEPEDEGAQVIDLMQVLKQSIQRTSAAPGGEDLTKRSKSELYDRAKELDISGRSGMTKEELIDAIREAG